jgi:hypothetical protein
MAGRLEYDSHREQVISLHRAFQAGFIFWSHPDFYPGAKSAGFVKLTFL